MPRTHIFIDAGFKNEISYRFSFVSESEHIKKMISELIGGGSVSDNDDVGIYYITIPDEHSTLKTLRIIACDDATFMILKTHIELNKECFLITL